MYWKLKNHLEKINQYKDNVINKTLKVYNDLLEDKENVNYNDIKTVSDTINNIIEK